MKKFNLHEHQGPLIMGILNVTPDSFSDGGQFNSVGAAVKQAQRMLMEGADIIDIGGESTRPGAPEVSESEELDRVLPVIEILKRELGCAISLDTSKAAVMKAGIEAGVDLINDVCALSQPSALEVVAASHVPVCLMHMQGTPRTMQDNPQYSDIIEVLKEFFEQKISLCENAGLEKSRIWLDPGFGFGKSLHHNYELLNRMDELNHFGLPILAGISRKSMLGNLLNLPADQRGLSSVIAATLAMTRGAKILRVHDVAETKQAVTLFNATQYGVINE